ncbi:MAG: AI-2E family transporter [Rikenellaceae bacterium]
MKLSSKYKISAALIGVLVLGFSMWYFSTILFYILASAFFALVGKPIVRLVEKLKIGKWTPPRSISAFVALITMMVLLVAIASTLFPVIADQLEVLSRYDITEVGARLKAPLHDIEVYVNDNFPESHFSIQEAISNKVKPYMEYSLISNTLGTLAGMATEIIMAMFCVSFITYFFLIDDKMFGSWVVILFPTKYEENVKRALDSVSNLLRRYFIGILAESLIKFIIVSVALYIIGLPLNVALLISLITAVLNVIPYVGPIIGGVIALIITALNPLPGVEMFDLFTWIFVVLVAFQLFDNIILQPYIYASSVKAHPLEIFIVILLASYIAGIFGMLVAIPVYTVLRVFAKEFFSNLKLVKSLTDSI